MRKFGVFGVANNSALNKCSPLWIHGSLKNI